MSDPHEKVHQLQILEQQLQQIIGQKQQIQLQQAETENAIRELRNTSENPYKIIGNLMIKTDKKELEKELEERKEVYDLRLKTLEKQEKQIQEKAEAMQKEVMEELKH